MQEGGKSQQTGLSLTHFRSQESETLKIQIKCQHNLSEIRWNGKTVALQKKKSNLPKGFLGVVCFLFVFPKEKAWSSERVGLQSHEATLLLALQMAKDTLPKHHRHRFPH